MKKRSHEKSGPNVETCGKPPYYFFPGDIFIANFSPLEAILQIIIYQFK